VSDIVLGNYWELSQHASGKIAGAEPIVGVGLIPGMSDPRLGANVSPLVRAIFARMNQLGLTPFSLAAKTGRNATYFRDLFQGRSAAPSTKFLPAIAAALECEVADLLKPESACAEPNVDGEVYKADEIALLTFWRGLSPAAKARVMRAIIREGTKVRQGKPETSE